MKRTKLSFIISIILIVLLSSCELAFNKENSQKGKVWFIGYGCDYQSISSVRTLNKTINDIVELGKAFESLSDKAKVEYEAVYFLGDSTGSIKNAHTPTWEEYKKILSDLSIADNDILIFSFSAHGFDENEGSKKYEYGTYDAFDKNAIAFCNKENNNTNLISYGTVYSFIQDLPGTKVILCDTCYSGSFIVGDDVSVNSDVYKDNPAKLLFDFDINQSSSVWVLSASTYYQVSSEPFDHGLFTGCVLDALGWDETQSVHKLGKINCLNGNMISIGSITKYIYTHGARATINGNTQIPVFSAGSSDVILFKF